MDESIENMSVTSGIGKAGWRLFECGSAASTNDLAKSLPVWSAVRADQQSGGRGRFGRAFVSDPGGLWISAILPAPGGPARWAGFSLMVGHHLVRMLQGLNLASARLRWPNDLMAGKKKLGGLLIEQSAREALVVGFGLNVSNSPWNSDPSLEAIATSLSSLSNPAPAVDEMAVHTLDALTDAHEAMESGGMPSAIEQLNPGWSAPRAVEITLSHGEKVGGRFVGLDPAGNLRLLNDRDCEFLVGHQSIEKLTELQ